MLRLALALFVLSPAPLVAQSLYDFDQLSGSDQHPFTQLDGQDNWTEETFNAPNRCGVTATLSHDGTQSLRFQEVGPGYGCDASRINDSSWSFTPFSGAERAAYFQVDMLVGFWGGEFGLAHDTDGDGVIRRYQAGERGIRFVLGAQSGRQLKLIDAAGTSYTAPLADLGISGGDWVTVRVVMDIVANSGAGFGQVEVRNISAGEVDFSVVPGLVDIPLALDRFAADASNPVFWDAVWLHFEGATYSIDNIEIGDELAFAKPYGSGCGPTPLGLDGAASPVLGSVAGAELFDLPASGVVGAVLIGVMPSFAGVDLTPIGMPNCSLYHLETVGVSSFAVTGPTGGITQSIPATPALSGIRVFLQGAVIAPGENQLGVLTSNGLIWTLGLR